MCRFQLWIDRLLMCRQSQEYYFFFHFKCQFYYSQMTRFTSSVCFKVEINQVFQDANLTSDAFINVCCSRKFFIRKSGKSKFEALLENLIQIFRFSNTSSITCVSCFKLFLFLWVSAVLIINSSLECMKQTGRTKIRNTDGNAVGLDELRDVLR